MNAHVNGRHDLSVASDSHGGRPQRCSLLKQKIGRYKIMRTISTVIQHRHAPRMLSAIVLSIAVTVVGIVQYPDGAVAKVTTQPAVVTPLATVPMLTGTLATVNNGPGSQSNPRVYRDRVSYTNDDLQGSSLIHYFDFSTATDNIVPGNGFDRLSNVAGTRVAWTELTALGDHVVVFDTATQILTAVCGFKCSNPALSSNLVAFENRNFTNPTQSEIDVYDFNTTSVTRLTNDALFDLNPALSPTGSAVVWEKCITDAPVDAIDCDIYSAIQTSPGVFTTHALTDATSEDHRPDTNGDIVVYTSNRGGETDVYYQPVGGGVETQIAIPGDQRDVRISGNMIVFESHTATAYDVYAYNVSSGILYQVTNTPFVDETLSNISVWNGMGRIVWAAPGNGDFDIYAFTFQIPSSVPSQINNLIALVQSFQLPHGIENSLLTKLQDALTALSASDTATACDSLRAFINQCSAQSGKALTEEQAGQLINAATELRTELGCQ
jgi:hypothetical protein